MVTVLKAVSADGYVFPTFLIIKGEVNTYGQFGNLKVEDADTRFAKSPKGWTDNELAYQWLIEVYHPYSLKRIQLGEKRLLILDGYSSHINVKFIKFCEAYNIILYFLPPHSTRLLQPLDVCLFGPLQKYYGKSVEDYYLARGAGTRHRNPPQLYKKARSQAYTLQNIEAAFQTTEICPFNSRAVTAPIDYRN
jgi:hypothetical protein